MLVLLTRDSSELKFPPICTPLAVEKRWLKTSLFYKIYVVACFYEEGIVKTAAPIVAPLHPFL